MDAIISSLTASSGLLLKFEINLRKTARDKRTIQFCRKRTELLEQYWNQYLGLYMQLLQLPGSLEVPYVEDNTFDAVQECYLEAKALLDLWRQPLQRTTAPSLEQQAPIQAASLSGKLPKLDLPQFSGDLREWETFRDLFKAMVHNHSGLSAAVKLQYLKSTVKGEAEQLIRNIAVSDANYADAWDTLANRYDNPRTLVQSHLRALNSLAAVGKESASGIKRLLDSTNECVRALKNLQQPVEHWDAILVDLTCHRLDQQSRRDWETSLGDSREFPTWAQLATFLETRTRALEAARIPNANCTNSNSLPTTPSGRTGKSGVSTHAVTTNNQGAAQNKGRKCPLCSELHYIGACQQYKTQDANQRSEHVRRLGLCRNCLGRGHLVAACPSTKRCNLCGSSHHTTLHSADRRSSQAPEASTSSNTTSTTGSATNNTSVHANHVSVEPQARAILLGTAQVVLISKSGRRVLARALIDPCSEGCFTSEDKAQALRASRTPVVVPVNGVVGAKAGVSKSSVSVEVSSRWDSSVKMSVVAYVLPRVTADFPSRAVPAGEWNHVTGLPLADPEFGEPGKIDMILGADVYRELLLSGVRSGPPGTPIAQETIFGWILTGSVPQPPAPTNDVCHDVRVHHCAIGKDLTGLVRKFWELDELPASNHLTDDEEKCEAHFRETHCRDEAGRYVVRLPFREDPARALGESRRFACRALERGERRREADPTLESEYARFLSEYLSLGHMELAPVGANASDGAPQCYMPHHPVVREIGGATKLRVVFNASHPTSSGKSLNDLLLPGPKLQANIITVLMRWRRHRIVFAADIVKMFRQILVAAEDRDFQRIVWRDSPNSPIQDARLLTVTYGTACAPYLAIRTLQQLAQDEAHRFPGAAEVVCHDTYVDDTLTGADDLQAARQLKHSLINLLRCGGFELGKWMSNSQTLLEDTDLPTNSTLSFEPDDLVRTLGVVWSPSDDSFRVKLNLDSKPTTATKRSLLSELARTFDPLGWLAPVLVRAKILFQDTWITGIDWDESLPQELLTPWLQLRSTLPLLEELVIPRWLGPSCRPRRYQLHGFSDASERAFSAAIYVRVPSDNDTCSVTLLCAKTRVAPLKSVSLPRLELCGAVLLARLMASVRNALQDDLAEDSFAWSDSTVTLAWLQGHPSRWVTFVANRVAEIHTLLPNTIWQHVKSDENPADLATRGIPPGKLIEAQLWWQGPKWLRSPPSEWPQRASASVITTNLDLRLERQAHAAHILQENDFLNRFSRLQRLLRITAWCLRLRTRNRNENEASKDARPLSATEIASARQRWILITQAEAFHDEITALERNQRLPVRSPLIKLTPFLDKAGVLRLGGRLQEAVLSYEERHPAILPKTSRFSEMLIRHAHEATLHGGPQLTWSYLLRFYWILNGRNRVRAAVHRCVDCARHRAATPRQLMGQLPPSRITKPTRPFERTGLDYAGPFLLRASSGRGRTTYKAYLALFVCLSTRAIHLEVVSSYTTASFLAAFKRFSARRGICSELHSDNGTNFRGADQELRSLFLAASSTSREIAAALANDGTQWHFIPPHAPHFGGMWEAGVRSTKHHLRRVIGDTILTYEEFATVAAQIEGCLNSRPLSPLSSDPTDLVALTPGHFLIGGAPTTPPEPSTSHVPVGRMGRWQLTSHMLEDFWHRWSTEYLHHLQQRNKWTSKGRNITTGDLVLVRSDLLPPAKWPLARVIATHPGPDGLTRVVTVKTAASTYKRPIVKLVLLPVQESDPAENEY